jgi:hypothetical protein
MGFSKLLEPESPQQAELISRIASARDNWAQCGIQRSGTAKEGDRTAKNVQLVRGLSFVSVIMSLMCTRNACSNFFVGYS